MKAMRSYDAESTPLKGTMLLEASAGTGKTYALERMVTRLVGRSDNPLEIGEILVVTFTRRAAREMKERIRFLLSSRLRDPERNSAERERYSKALSEFDGAPIYTIHGFCQMVLSTWPFESSSPFHQNLEPGGQLESEAARRWLAGLDESDIDGQLLRAAYSKAKSVEALVGQITRELTRDDIPPGSVVLPGSEESTAFALFLESSGLPDSSLSRAAHHLLSRHWSDESLTALSRAVSGKPRGGKKPDSLKMVRLHLEACRGVFGIHNLSAALFGDPGDTGVRNHFLDVFRDGVSYVRGEAADSESLSPGDEALELAEALHALACEMEPYIEIIPDPKISPLSLVERYMHCAFLDLARKAVEPRVEELKETEGRWGYADLIRRVAEAVEKSDSSLRRLLQKKFRAALIDEFQDTDPRQWALFRNLFEEKSHLLALIGDPKQSIYGFRGTGLQAYEAARSSVDTGNSFRLDTNYRSVPTLVEAVNRLFEGVFQRGCGNNSPVGFSPVMSGKEAFPRLEYEGVESSITALEISTMEKGSSVELAVDALIAELRYLLDPQRGGMLRFADDSLRPVSPGDIAVLVRTSATEEKVLSGLSSLGIPGLRVRSRSVFTQNAASLMRGLLEALDKPRDSSRWRSVLLGGLFRLPPVLLHRFEEEGRLDAFVERGELWRDSFLSGHSSEAFESFFRFAPGLANWAAETGRSDLAAGLDRSWPVRVISEPGGERSWQDWRHLSDLIQQKQSEGLREPAALISWMYESEAAGDSDGGEESLRLETEDPAVSVMTMHAAKGLEFPLVFLVGDLKGTSRRKDSYRFDDDGVLTVDRIGRERNRLTALAYEWEETKRLWYVSFTRASVKTWFVRPTDGVITGIDSLLAEAIGYGDGDSSALPPHELLARDDVFRAGLEDALEAWCQDGEGLLTSQPGQAGLLPPLGPPIQPEVFGAPLPEDQSGNRDPVTGSYTSLIRSAGAFHNGSSPGSLAASGGGPGGRGEVYEPEDRDVDRHTGDTLPPSGSTSADEALPLSTDRGALFGTLVHALFEDCDFSLARDDDSSLWMRDSSVEELFSLRSGRYYSPDWYRSRASALKSLVRSTLRAPIPGLGRLCDIENSQLRAEVEFLMAIPRSARYPIPGRDESIRMERGFLKGFIDLLVHDGERWWVVDWKTNVPAAALSAADYSPEAVREMMDHHSYHLQYELYLLALCRNLSTSLGRPLEWENEIGGAAYLFVRGMHESNSRGVFKARPERDRMLFLAEEAGLDGVIK